MGGTAVSVCSGAAESNNIKTLKLVILKLQIVTLEIFPDMPARYWCFASTAAN